MLDARIRLILLIFLTIFYGISSQDMVPGIVLTTFFICYIQRDSFSKVLIVIVISSLILGIFMFIVWIITPSLVLSNLVLEYMRWVSLIITSVVLFSSMNVMDTVLSLAYFKIPIRIAISIGVSLRFIHIIYAESQRIFVMQRKRGITLSYKALGHYGFLGLLDRLISPLLISVVRLADSISLSIVVQQIEERITDYKLPSVKIKDLVILLLVALCFFIFSYTLKYIFTNIFQVKYLLQALYF